VASTRSITRMNELNWRCAADAESAALRASRTRRWRLIDRHSPITVGQLRSSCPAWNGPGMSVCQADGANKT